MKNKLKNFAVTMDVKHKNPITGIYDYKFACPAVNNQAFRTEGNFNYFAITCSPSKNGIYRYPAEKTNTFGKWSNGKIDCLLVPVDEVEYFCSLEETPNETALALIKATQKDYCKLKGYKEKRPWML